MSEATTPKEWGLFPGTAPGLLRDSSPMARDLGILLTDALATKARLGLKTVTRRPVESRLQEADCVEPCEEGLWEFSVLEGATGTPLATVPARILGSGIAEVGGRLWVRECFAESGELVVFRADHPEGYYPGAHLQPWRPSIHMSKRVARTWGRIVSVRPERLFAITNEDAVREGFPGRTLDAPGTPWHGRKVRPKAQFCVAWDRAYRERGLGFKANPWVWRIEWEPIERPKL